MSADIKPGDEVTLCRAVDWRTPRKWYQLWKPIYRYGKGGPVFGDVVTVTGCGLLPESSPYRLDGDLPMLQFKEWPGEWYASALFRKVQRRDIAAWLAAENTIEGPVRQRESA